MVSNYIKLVRLKLSTNSARCVRKQLYHIKVFSTYRCPFLGCIIHDMLLTSPFILNRYMNDYFVFCMFFYLFIFLVLNYPSLLCYANIINLFQLEEKSIAYIQKYVSRHKEIFNSRPVVKRRPFIKP